MSESTSSGNPATARREGNDETIWVSLVKRQVRSLHFGVVQIVVHNGRVVQIDRTEKFRLNEANRLAAGDSLGKMEGI